MTPRSHSRRSVISAAAWSAPAIAVAAAAPAYAASPSQNTQISFALRQLVATPRPNTLTQAYFYTTTYGSTYRSDTDSNLTYMAWEGTTPETTISNVRLTMYFDNPDIVFSNGNNHSSCWTLLKRDPSLPNKTHNKSGRSLYAYSAQYTCPITTGNTRTQIADFEWDARNPVTVSSTNYNYRYWGREVFYTLNGVPMNQLNMDGENKS